MTKLNQFGGQWPESLAILSDDFVLKNRSRSTELGLRGPPVLMSQLNMVMRELVILCVQDAETPCAKK